LKTITYREVTYRCPFADLLRPLNASESMGLEQSIREHGILVPVLLDENNNVIDGQHRLQMAARLTEPPKRLAGSAKIVECPFKVVTGLTEKQKRQIAIAANAERRHLTAAERRELLTQRIKADPARSNRAIADELQVDDKTVGAARKRLEATAEIPQLNATTGRDGKKRGRPAPPKVKLFTPPEPTKPRNPEAQALLDGDPEYQGALLDKERREAKEKPKAAVHPQPETGHESRGKGIALAHQAINLLQSIPKNDALRKRGFEVVLEWVQRNLRKMSCPEVNDKDEADTTQDAGNKAAPTKPSQPAPARQVYMSSEMHEYLDKLSAYVANLAQRKPGLSEYREEGRRQLAAVRKTIVAMEQLSWESATRPGKHSG
jgi:hypothetical protein